MANIMSKLFWVQGTPGDTEEDQAEVRKSAQRRIHSCGEQNSNFSKMLRMELFKMEED